ncbi:pantoate--beta-alanine ligase [Seinonella peptonophila]|uniref:Pantothenate synthetase n=1 Tax=Seinonella peptonophila TaxID=112248 RepID=A0A1M4SVG0_9BACL|nr:pantoate--beta-alanine ligase [Seinonella peptonophila]SHE36017.1 pantoate--beta-alanine ligase [Seinonella peptonophila]
MKHIKQINQLRVELKQFASQTIGFVPTMGYLHLGHLELIKRAREECDIVVLSIFVNPLQFGPNEDFSRYPRDIERDEQLAKEAGVDFLFSPSVEEMYPEKPLTHIEVDEITSKLCGSSRPGHFSGVATVVTKLFHIVSPDRAYFGLKDAQQVAVVEQLVKDLSFPVEIVPCDIVREEDGLALSSRNVYLSSDARKQATVLYRALKEIQANPPSDPESIRSILHERISATPLARIDYIDVLSYPGLQAVTTIENQTVIVAVAVYFDQTRLIDNILLR